ncbi:unnamed protein product [Staurois parvus]|uniref:Uncharacterized protein n=1 Tax=Staurois parvus TaxID=386267 RepID=A0ABN9BF26_9NEOB|nr:unnamed protein product [Staurois parvus]
MLSLVCIARKSICDQHRANQHCPDRGLYGFCILLEQNENSSYKV